MSLVPLLFVSQAGSRKMVAPFSVELFETSSVSFLTMRMPCASSAPTLMVLLPPSVVIFWPESVPSTLSVVPSTVVSVDVLLESLISSTAMFVLRPSVTVVSSFAVTVPAVSEAPSLTVTDVPSYAVMSPTVFWPPVTENDEPSAVEVFVPSVTSAASVFVLSPTRFSAPPLVTVIAASVTGVRPVFVPSVTVRSFPSRAELHGAARDGDGVRRRVIVRFLEFERRRVEFRNGRIGGRVAAGDGHAGGAARRRFDERAAFRHVGNRMGHAGRVRLRSDDRRAAASIADEILRGIELGERQVGIIEEHRARCEVDGVISVCPCVARRRLIGGDVVAFALMFA